MALSEIAELDCHPLKNTLGYRSERTSRYSLINSMPCNRVKKSMVFEIKGTLNPIVSCEGMFF